MKTDKNEKTLIVGASPNPARYAYLAANMLNDYGYDFLLFGVKKGEVLGRKIINDWDEIPGNIHTVTLYVGAAHQSEIIPKILKLKPARIIFNPGTENYAFEENAKQLGIEALEACTLVLLRTGQY